MSDVNDVLSDFDPIEDVASADLGDTRRSKRFKLIVEAAIHRPERSVPEMFEEEAALEGYYRFIRSPHVDDMALLKPHFEASAARAAKLGHVLCLHDTTEFSFPVRDDELREQLARPSTNRQGFHWHASLVTSSDGLRAPMGLVEARAFVHSTDLVDEESQKYWADRGGIFENEKWRWYQSIEAAELRLQNAESVTHVMDREFDDFQMLYCMNVDGYDYVARLRYNRNVSTGPLRKDFIRLQEALTGKVWRGKRTVELSPRSAAEASSGHPVRRVRKATLKIRSARVELRRPNSVDPESAPNTLTVNVVEVREVNTPTGEEPVRWMLITSHPVGVKEQMWEVVDYYRARWTIEEYFKAIKTGCAYKELQHRSAKTLLCALSATAVVAHHLLTLRHFGRHAPHLPALAVVTRLQIMVLQATKAEHLSARPTAGEVMAAVASLGGHIRSNGAPGWQVLSRGWQRLLEYEHGFALGLKAQEKM